MINKSSVLCYNMFIVLIILLVALKINSFERKVIWHLETSTRKVIMVPSFGLTSSTTVTESFPWGKYPKMN